MEEHAVPLGITLLFAGVLAAGIVPQNGNGKGEANGGKGAAPQGWIQL